MNGVAAVAQAAAVSQLGGYVEELGAIVDLAVMVAIHHQQAVGWSHPTHFARLAGAVQIEHRSVRCRPCADASAGEVEHCGPGREYTIDLLARHDGRVLASNASTWAMYIASRSAECSLRICAIHAVPSVCV